MTPQARNYLANANYFVAFAIGACSLWLLSMPLHPPAEDHHGGLMAAFSGLFLVPVANAAFVTGRLHRRASASAWWMLGFVIVLVTVLLLTVLLP